MSPAMTEDLLRRSIESSVILGIALILFFGLKGRILVFARWANLPRLAFAPVRLLIRYAVLVVALLLVLGRWGFEIGTITAVLSSILGLVAIGFVAVWSVLSNFLCTFVLVAFKPFLVGDELEFPQDNVKGKVVDLSMIFTTLEVSPGEVVVIPNNTFFQKPFRRKLGTVTVDLDYQLRQDAPQPSFARSSAET